MRNTAIAVVIKKKCYWVVCAYRNELFSWSWWAGRAWRTWGAWSSLSTRGSLVAHRAPYSHGAWCTGIAIYGWWRWWGWWWSRWWARWKAEGWWGGATCHCTSWYRVDTVSWASIAARACVTLERCKKTTT